MKNKVMSKVIRSDRANIEALLEEESDVLSDLTVMRSASGGTAKIRVAGVGTIEVSYEPGAGLYDVVEGLRRVADAFDP